MLVSVHTFRVFASGPPDCKPTLGASVNAIPGKSTVPRAAFTLPEAVRSPQVIPFVPLSMGTEVVTDVELTLKRSAPPTDVLTFCHVVSKYTPELVELVKETDGDDAEPLGSSTGTTLVG